jgi:hypothetical protein
MNRMMTYRIDGTILLQENERELELPAGLSQEEIVAAMLAFYTPDPAPEETDPA